MENATFFQKLLPQIRLKDNTQYHNHSNHKGDNPVHGFQLFPVLVFHKHLKINQSEQKFTLRISIAWNKIVNLLVGVGIVQLFSGNFLDIIHSVLLV